MEKDEIAKIEILYFPTQKHSLLHQLNDSIRWHISEQ